MAFKDLQRIMRAAKAGFRAFTTAVSRAAANRSWLLSLERPELLALIFEPDTGLDKEDKDTLVKMAFQSFSDEEKRQRLIRRLARRLQRRPKLRSSESTETLGKG
jgi:hypothetical protein